jgi:hypothetical protein
VWIVDGLFAGIIAGVFMGVVSEIGNRLGLIKSHLVIIDGEYGLKMLKRDYSRSMIYAVGTTVHLITSLVFGITYTTIAHFANFDYRHLLWMPLYIMALWLAMLFTALPIAGQGIAGRNIRKHVWAEQAVLHVVYGLGFWWTLGLL